MCVCVCVCVCVLHKTVAIRMKKEVGGARTEQAVAAVAVLTATHLHIFSQSAFYLKSETCG